MKFFKFFNSPLKGGLIESKGSVWFGRCFIFTSPRFLTRFCLGLGVLLFLSFPVSSVFGQCSVTIDRVEATGTPGATPTSISVFGSSNGCHYVGPSLPTIFPCSLKVTVTCPTTKRTLEKRVLTSTTGEWAAVFGPADGLTDKAGCECGSAVTVTAECIPCSKTIIECTSAELRIKTLECTPPTKGACPDIQLRLVSIGDCNADGTRTVKLRAIITAGSVEAEVKWIHDNGNMGSPCVITASTRAQCPPNLRSTSEEELEEVNYLPGLHTSSLEILSPKGCKQAGISINVPSCRASTCPYVTILDAGKPQGCAGGGSTVRVTFTGTLSGSALGCQFEWNFGDERPGTTPIQTDAPNISHDYATPGTYTPSVVLVCPNCSRRTTSAGEVVIPPCCPVVTGITPDSNGCSLTFVATTTPSPAPGTYNWDFGDGSSASEDDPITTHTYAGRDEPYEVVVTFTPNAPGTKGCDNSTARTSVTVAPCPTGPPPGAGTTMSAGCWVLLILALFFLLISVIALIIAGCGGGAWWWWVIAGAAFLLGIFFLILWGLMCARTACGILNFLVVLFRWLAIAAGASAFIGAIASRLGIAIPPICLVSLALETVDFAIVLVILYWIAETVGCVIWR